MKLKDFKLAYYHFKTGNLEISEQICHNLIEENDQNSDAIHLISVILVQKKNYNSALNYINKLLLLNPNNADILNKKGSIFLMSKKYIESIDMFNKAISLKKKFPEALNNKAISLQFLNKEEESLKIWIELIDKFPSFLEPYNNLGNYYNSKKKFKEALKYYTQTLNLKPNHFNALKNRAEILIKKKDFSTAVSDLKKCYSQNSSLDILNLLIHFKKVECDWDLIEKYQKEILEKISKGETCENPIFILSFSDSLKLQKKAAEISAIDSNIKKIKFKSKFNKRIKIAYFSSDFREHAVSRLIKGLLRSHNRKDFEIIGFDLNNNLNKNNTYDSKFLKLFDNYITTFGKTDENISKLSREMKIDIAVDLMGYTNNNRFKIFSYGCAPKQINYLGYPGTTGSKNIDYIVADKNLISKNNQKFYSEKILYLPNCYQPNDKNSKFFFKKFSRKDFGLPNDKFILCCFNQSYKITPEMFYIWVNILKKKTNCVLWLLDENKNFRINILNEAKKLGLKKNRIFFAKRIKNDDHLSRHSLADLFIDTFPYTAHTTASDAIRANLPLVTKKGHTFASRVASSLLKNLDLNELVAKNNNKYEQIILNLISNKEKLNKIKSKISKNISKSSAFNIKLYTKNLESLFKKICK